jgi:cobalt/nickel transport protein
MKLELIALGFIMIFIAAFAYVSSSGNHEWSGADDQAKDTISKLTGDTYKSWFHSVWTPPQLGD